MKENLFLESNPITLKQIIENLDKIPKDGGASFGDETKKLTSQEKRRLMEKVSDFNEYGKILRCETAIMEMAKTLSEISNMAESYVMSESGDFFNAETSRRDFKEIKSITKDFQRLARECFGDLQRLNALYEDLGSKYSRYFEIRSLDEISNPVSSNTKLSKSSVEEI